jgi:segregation and condensation protein A
VTILYKLDTFEGPLDLLLHLIDTAEIDVHQIPIREITDQYMEYLRTMQEVELEVTSEFLVMAATLLSIKSKMLLPKPPAATDEEFWPEENGPDPRAELVQKLIEYRKFKEIAQYLRGKEQFRNLMYTREPMDLTPYLPQTPKNPVEGLTTAHLLAALRRALNRQAERNRVARIRRDEISVKERMSDVIGALRSRGGKLLFSNLFRRGMGRIELVATFLALLELMKLRRIQCYQNRLFDDIVIQLREEAADDGLHEIEIDY